MRAGKEVFLVVKAGVNAETGGTHHRIDGTLRPAGEDAWEAVFPPFESAEAPVLAQEGVYLGFKGATLTAKAFDRVMPGLGLWIVPATAWLFAYSTLISWSYYGERCWQFLVGAWTIKPYRVLWTVAVFFGAVTHLDLAWTIADTLNALMAVPNLIALLALSPVVVQLTRAGLSDTLRAS